MSRLFYANLIATISFAIVLIFPLSTMHAGDRATAEPAAAATGWNSLPAGSRVVFIGVHGGTTPVTLHPKSDGTPLALPGGSGQDFLRLIRSPETAKADLATGGSITFWLKQITAGVPNAGLFASETLEQNPRHTLPPLPARFPEANRQADDDA